jgi:hypothetical protein
MLLLQRKIIRYGQALAFGYITVFGITTANHQGTNFIANFPSGNIGANFGTNTGYLQSGDIFAVHLPAAGNSLCAALHPGG